MKEIKFNPTIGRLVVVPNINSEPTPDDPIATQAEILQFAADTEYETTYNPEMLNEVIDSLTVKETPDSTTIEEGVESITEKV
jgi:hypothetical protein|tara:strand:- start:552 stop:800 length:249 start_codon:yes stop_codon:yes gene_type:complete